MIIKAADADRTMDLDIKELQDGFEYEKICYLLNYKAGVTQQEKGFYTFYVKDKFKIRSDMKVILNIDGSNTIDQSYFDTYYDIINTFIFPDNGSQRRIA